MDNNKTDYEYVPAKQTEFLKVEHVNDGDSLTILEAAKPTWSDTKQKNFWNFKVALPNGTEMVAGINDITGAELVKAWGTKTAAWIGHKVVVNLRVAKSTGNPYIVLLPTTDEKEAVQEPVKADTGNKVEYPSEKIDPADIPF